MKKRFKKTVFLLVILISLKGFAQVPPDTSTTQKLLQYIFQPIDKNQIPSGYLEEYGCPMLPMATFNGTLTDSNRIDMNLWRTLYLQFQTGWTRVTANPLPAITAVNTTILQNVSSTLPIPIPLLIGQYNTVKTNAFTSNLLAYNNSTKQVSDVPGRSQNPYDTKSLFAACPNSKQSVTGTETFVIKPAMIWNNTTKTINLIQIDFANGQGFQNVTVNTPVSITYADTGYKKWTIKVTLSDNSILQCYNEYYVLRTANSTARFQSPQSVVPAWGNVNTVTGVRSAATIWVNYSNRNRTNTLRKPLIIVEGYDVSFIASSLQSNYGVRDLISALNEPAGYDFNSQLDDIAGYDLVFVDFANGAADIVLNAGAVQEVINRVNTNKVLDARFGNIRQQNVVLGLSMGGLCARYALANMTKNFPGSPTETRLLITHDSPHKGANVPLGLQYMIRMMGGVQLFGYNIYDIYPNYNDAIGLLNAPATQQLLLYRATSANTYATNTFLDATYRPMITFGTTGPQPTYRFIATALGNECANPLFSPGKTFVNLGAGISAGIDARFLFFRVPILSYKLAAQVEAYALPAAGSTNKIARVYTINNLKLFGLINIFKQLYDNTAYAPGNHLAIDGVPGSNYPLLDVQALNQLTSLPIFAVNLYVTFPLGPFLSGYFGAYAYNQGVSYNFTFVPVASALDAAPYTTPIFSQSYVNGVNQNYPSTAETFIAQETNNAAGTTNNLHIRFTPRNARWLYNEMENLNNPENCSAECFNPYYISGISQTCGSATYNIPGLQRGVSVTWSFSPSWAVTYFATGNSVTITRSSGFNGPVTITAVIGAGCNTGSTITKQITIGNPDPPIGTTYVTSNYYYTSQTQITTPLFWFMPAGQTGYVTYTITDPTVVPQSWSTISGNAPIISADKRTLYFSINTGQTASYQMTALGPCGTYTKNFGATVMQGGGFRIAASPNPAFENLIVSIKDESTEVKALNTKENIVMSMYAFNTNVLVKEWSFKNTQKDFSLNVSGLPKGQYILVVSKGTYKLSQQIIIGK